MIRRLNVAVLGIILISTLLSAVPAFAQRIVWGPVDEFHKENVDPVIFAEDRKNFYSMVTTHFSGERNPVSRVIAYKRKGLTKLFEFKLAGAKASKDRITKDGIVYCSGEITASTVLDDKLVIFFAGIEKLKKGMVKRTVKRLLIDVKTGKIVGTRDDLFSAEYKSDKNNMNAGETIVQVVGTGKDKKVVIGFQNRHPKTLAINSKYVMYDVQLQKVAETIQSTTEKAHFEVVGQTVSQNGTVFILEKEADLKHRLITIDATQKYKRSVTHIDYKGLEGKQPAVTISRLEANNRGGLAILGSFQSISFEAHAKLKKKERLANPVKSGTLKINYNTKTKKLGKLNLAPRAGGKHTAMMLMSSIKNPKAIMLNDSSGNFIYTRELSGQDLLNIQVGKLNSTGTFKWSNTVYKFQKGGSHSNEYEKKFFSYFPAVHKGELHLFYQDNPKNAIANTRTPEQVKNKKKAILLDVSVDLKSGEISKNSKNLNAPDDMYIYIGSSYHTLGSKYMIVHARKGRKYRYGLLIL